MNSGKVLCRSILRAIRKLPLERRREALAILKQEVKEHAQKKGRALEAVLARAQQQLQYVRMLTPNSGVAAGAGGRYVLREGHLVAASSVSCSRMSVRVEGPITSEHLARHNSLLRRQHFMEGPLKRKH